MGEKVKTCCEVNIGEITDSDYAESTDNAENAENTKNADIADNADNTERQTMETMQTIFRTCTKQTSWTKMNQLGSFCKQQPACRHNNLYQPDPKPAIYNYISCQAAPMAQYPDTVPHPKPNQLDPWHPDK